MLSLQNMYTLSRLLVIASISEVMCLFLPTSYASWSDNEPHVPPVAVRLRLYAFSGVSGRTGLDM